MCEWTVKLLVRADICIVNNTRLNLFQLNGHSELKKNVTHTAQKRYLIINCVGAQHCCVTMRVLMFSKQHEINIRPLSRLVITAVLRNFRCLRVGGCHTCVIIIHLSIKFRSPDESGLHHLHLHGLHLFLHVVKLALVDEGKEALFIINCNVPSPHINLRLLLLSCSCSPKKQWFACRFSRLQRAIFLVLM